MRLRGRRAVAVGVVLLAAAASGAGCNSLLGIRSPLGGETDGGTGGNTGGRGGGNAGSGGRGGATVGTGGAAGGGGIGGRGASGGTAGSASGGSGSGGRGGTGTGGVGTGGGGTAGTNVGGRGGTGTGGSGTGGTGGSASTGGSGGGGGIGGAGGATVVCSTNATRCAGTGVQTCSSNGQWGATVACGSHQSCAGPVGTAACACNADPVCSSLGSACASVSAIGVCMQDAQACYYESSSMVCANGACSGSAGSAACCTNACASGATQCQTGTTLQTCGAGSNGCTIFAASTCASGLACERYAPAACLDPNWAAWPIPNVPADVTDGASNPESYTDNGDGTVTDNVTLLMWQQHEPGGMTLANALAYCDTLSLGGHDDWRLPAAIELLSLFDVTQPDPSPTINPTYFGTTATNWFWSSTPGTQYGAWIFDFSNNERDQPDPPATAGVRCVR